MQSFVDSLAGGLPTPNPGAMFAGIITQVAADGSDALKAVRQSADILLRCRCCLVASWASLSAQYVCQLAYR